MPRQPLWMAQMPCVTNPSNWFNSPGKVLYGRYILYSLYPKSWANSDLHHLIDDKIIIFSTYYFIVKPAGVIENVVLTRSTSWEGRMSFIRVIVNAEIKEAYLPPRRQNWASMGSKLYAFLGCVSADYRIATQRLIILSLAKSSVLASYCVHYKNLVKGKDGDVLSGSEATMDFVYAPGAHGHAIVNAKIDETGLGAKMS